MNHHKKLNANERNLIRRYLVWCYKTTKEELDRIDRYYTQLDVDVFTLRILKADGDYKKRDDYRKIISDFEEYIKNKKINVDQKKYIDVSEKKLSADYVYLKNRFSAIEKAIQYFLGKKDLQKITVLYEEEMTQRILQAREHS